MKTFLARMTLLILVLALVTACGGSAAEPTPAPASPAEATAPSEAPTVAPAATATPLPEPTATPTEEPTETPTTVPAAPPTETPTATPEPTVAPEPTEAAAAAAVASGPCFNTFFPIVDGASWTYNTSGAGASTYTRSVTNVSDNGFTLTHTTSGSSTPLRIDYTCDDGGLVSGTLAGLPSMAGFSLEVTSFTGTNFPPADQWEVGASWSATYTVEGTGTVEGIDVALNGEITTVYEIVGEESVDVPAGTFDAYKVDSTRTQRLNMSMGGTSMPLEVSISSSDWYVEGVGQVKSVTYGDFASTTELVSYAGL
ncbi:MAG: hypothetical protein R2844_11325 [Caldilineales bacterium]